MAFTDETFVRNHSGLTDEDAIPSDLVDRSVDDAHAVILAELDPAYADSEDSVLALAETELATAFLLRTLAGNKAGLGRDLATMHLRIQELGKAPELRAQADEEEKRAWGRLARFLKTRRSPFGFELASPGEDL
jgi:hypothetical protein